MTTNEILFWSLVLVTWGLSMVAAYFAGRDRAYQDAMEIVDQAVDEKFREKLDELRKQRPIR